MRTLSDFDQARAALDRAVARIEAAGPRVSVADLRQTLAEAVWLRGNDQEALGHRGIVVEGRPDCTVIVPASAMRVGVIKIVNMGADNVILLSHRVQPRSCAITLRTQGSRCVAMFADVGTAPVTLPIIYMRSDEQLFYWGLGATSVGSRIEIEGAGCGVLIGDDCMFSSGVWIRNHDMHTIFDTDSLVWLNSVKADIVLEQHVWLGFEAVVGGAVRIGFGAIVGARAFLTRDVPEQALAAGLPAKVVRRDVSWCRSDHGLQPATLKRLEALRSFSSSKANGAV